jgi:uncharacterized protein YndB with AHSA1/START domain
MITVEKSIVIDRPVEDVFAFVSDHTNAPSWQRGLLEVRRTSDGPIGVGTRHTVVRMFMGRRLEASNEFTHYEPNQLVAFDFASNWLPGHGSYVVEPEGTDCAKVIARVELRPSGLFRVAEPLMAAVLSRDVAANLGDLKGLLEAKVEDRRVGGTLLD